VNVTIRPYETKDRAQVRRLFQDTAFHGRSFRAYFDDGEWLADFMTAAYTDAEPSGTFVAETPEGLVGYLTGTLDTDTLAVRWRRDVLPRIIKGFFEGGTWKNAKAWRFFWNGFLGFARGQEYHPRDLSARFPAHFHVNTDGAARGQRVGTKLVEAFFKHMRDHGVLAAHIRTASRDGHQHFFESCGFRILLSRRLTVWKYLGEPAYHLITYGINLKP
jgi:ribosomal protein S18 acetylase RimI-like enzyme